MITLRCVILNYEIVFRLEIKLELRQLTSPIVSGTSAPQGYLSNLFIYFRFYPRPLRLSHYLQSCSYKLSSFIDIIKIIKSGLHAV